MQLRREVSHLLVGDGGGGCAGRGWALTNVPALRKEHAQEEDKEGDAGADPAVEDVGRRLVEERLILLRACQFGMYATAVGIILVWQRTLCSLFVCVVTLLKGVVCSSGASIVEKREAMRREFINDADARLATDRSERVAESVAAGWSRSWLGAGVGCKVVEWWKWKPKAGGPVARPLSIRTRLSEIWTGTETGTGTGTGLGWPLSATKRLGHLRGQIFGCGSRPALQLCDSATLQAAHCAQCVASSLSFSGARCGASCLLGSAALATGSE